jgi:hypothetical protein
VTVFQPIPAAETAVTSCAELGFNRIARLLLRYGLTLIRQPADTPIPGSFWGEPEAGLIGRSLFARDDTPVHSALHEASHWIGMDESRRANLHTNAGGDLAEENAVCYLQAILADRIAGFGKERLFAEMDAWGYSFRLGSAAAWYERDADDARQWLLVQGLIDERGRPTWRVRR